MAGWARKEVWRTTLMRGDAVYRTVKLGSIWLSIQPRAVTEEMSIARRFGGDTLCSTMDEHYGPEPSWEGMR